MILKLNGSEEDAVIKMKMGSTLLFSIVKDAGKTKVKDSAGVTLTSNDVIIAVDLVLNLASFV